MSEKIENIDDMKKLLRESELMFEDNYETLNLQTMDLDANSEVNSGASSSDLPFSIITPVVTI